MRLWPPLPQASRAPAGAAVEPCRGLQGLSGRRLTSSSCSWRTSERAACFTLASSSWATTRSCRGEGRREGDTVKEEEKEGGVRRTGQAAGQRGAAGETSRAPALTLAWHSSHQCPKLPRPLAPPAAVACRRWPALSAAPPPAPPAPPAAPLRHAPPPVPAPCRAAPQSPAGARAQGGVGGMGSAGRCSTWGSWHAEPGAGQTGGPLLSCHSNRPVCPPLWPAPAAPAPPPRGAWRPWHPWRPAVVGGGRGGQGQWASSASAANAAAVWGGMERLADGEAPARPHSNRPSSSAPAGPQPAPPSCAPGPQPAPPAGPHPPAAQAGRQGRGGWAGCSGLRWASCWVLEVGRPTCHRRSNGGVPPQDTAQCCWHGR